MQWLSLSLIGMAYIGWREGHNSSSKLNGMFALHEGVTLVE